MTTTTLDIDLSPELQNTLSSTSGGTFAYAVFFSGNAAADFAGGVALVSGGAIVSGGHMELDLPQPYVGGKVYFIIQSVSGNSSNLFTISGNDTLGAGNSSSGGIASEADINWGAATTGDFRFDSFEVTLSNPANGAGDAGNLTEVNGFGIPMVVNISYTDGTSQTRGYDINGAQVFQEIKDGVNPQLVSYFYSAGPLKGDPRMALSPTEAETTGLPGASSTDWAPYVLALGSAISGGSVHVEVAGFFNGAPSVDTFAVGGTTYYHKVYHNPGLYDYVLTYDGASQTFYIEPQANSQIKGTIQITASALEDSIYSTLGNANILTSSGGTVYLSA